MMKILESHSETLRKLEDLERKDAEPDEKVSDIFEYLSQLEQSKQEETEFRTMNGSVTRPATKVIMFQTYN
jgi:cell shape-determining protein MreC